MLDTKLFPPTEAILVMDSRVNVLAVRSLKITGSWSKLFKMGDRYLDLSLRAGDAQAVLLGKVVCPEGVSGGTVALVGEKGETWGQAKLSPTGMFNLAIEQAGIYNLEMSIGQQQFVIKPVDVH